MHGAPLAQLVGDISIGAVIRRLKRSLDTLEQGRPRDDRRTAARQPSVLWLCAGSFIHVPNVLEQLPLAVFPLPDDRIFERLDLRISALGPEGSSADLSRRIGAERLH